MVREILTPLSHFSMGEGWGESDCGALSAIGPGFRSDLKPHCRGKRSKTCAFASLKCTGHPLPSLSHELIVGEGIESRRGC
jgi:hypothetical protein